jgi:very-short-patch-repair endonuclease
MITSNDILKFNIKHNYKYDYSCVNERIGQKICIICPTHGKFYQHTHHHLSSQIPCKYCRNDLRIKEQLEVFKNTSNEVHNYEYDYSKVNYINNKTKVNIICKKHDIFKQRPDVHIQGQGCPDCYNETKYTLDEFIEESNKVHNYIYDYSLIKKITSKVDIICKKHKVFNQYIHNHLMGQGCPDCSSSKGENKVERYLIENSIKYIKQYRFNDCVNKRTLPFDFYLPDSNICIEYDGKYHFTCDYTINNDKIKTDYCTNNGINLIRFNASNINNIKDYLK